MPFAPFCRDAAVAQRRIWREHSVPPFRRTPKPLRTNGRSRRRMRGHVARKAAFIAILSDKTSKPQPQRVFRRDVVAVEGRARPFARGLPGVFPKLRQLTGMAGKPEPLERVRTGQTGEIGGAGQAEGSVRARCAVWRRSRMPANSFACPGALAQTRCDRTVRVFGRDRGRIMPKTAGWLMYGPPYSRSDFEKPGKAGHKTSGAGLMFVAKVCCLKRQ